MPCLVTFKAIEQLPVGTSDGALDVSISPPVPFPDSCLGQLQRMLQRGTVVLRTRSVDPRQLFGLRHPAVSLQECLNDLRASAHGPGQVQLLVCL